MSFSGKLEELPLPHLLQIIATNRVSGKLSLTRRDGHVLSVVESHRSCETAIL